MRKVILPILLVAAVGFAVWKFGFAGGNGNGHVRLSGNIELTEVDLSFKLPGRLVELKVDEGDNVTQSQLVARMDSDELTRQFEREQAGVASAESGLVQLKTAISFQKETLEGDLSLKKADLANAQARLAELENGSRPQERAQAQAAVAEARTQATQASMDWERAQKLFANDDISAQQRDQFRTRAEATAALLRRSEQALALIEEGPRKEQIDQARAQVERARAALRLSEAGRLDLKRREEEIAMRLAEIARAKAQQGLLGVQLGDRELKSPVAGVVLTKSAEPGEVLAAGATVVTVGDIDRPWVRGYVSESELGRVKLGKAVEVTTDSYPGKKYRGKVTFISSEAEFTPKTIQTQEQRVKLVYRVKIEVENPGRELKSNMPVDAVITLD
jgi:HlyD family secretion protein